MKKSLKTTRPSTPTRSEKAVKAEVKKVAAIKVATKEVIKRNTAEVATRSAVTTVAAMASGAKAESISVPSKLRAKSLELSSKNLRVVSTQEAAIKSLRAVLSAPTKVLAKTCCHLAEVVRN